MAIASKAEGGALRAWLAEQFDDLLWQLSNFWFGMTLLGLWGFMTLLGVVIDQGKDPASYFDAFPAPLARLVLRLHLDNVYHGTAYVALIGFIIACMTLATFKRVIPARLPPLHPVKIDKVPLNARLELREEPTRVRERVAAFFRDKGYLVRKRELGGTEWTFADKHNWARRGVLIAHLGFVIVAIGTTLYWGWGYSGETAIVTGTEQTIPQNGTLLKLDHFAYKFQPIRTRNGLVYQPIDYVSDLEVAPRGGTLRPMVLRVNEPLNVAGTLYYQSSYGVAVSLALTKNGKPVAGAPQSALKEGEAFPIGTTPRSIRYERFVGTIERNGAIGPDPRPNNPGVILAVLDGDQLIGRALVPMRGDLALGNGYRVAPTRYAFFSGIQYRHDPGIPFVAVGAFVLLTGLVISFHFLPARLYVRVDETEGGSEVALAATTVKGFEIFEEQFADLVEALKKGLGLSDEPASSVPTSSH
jgi:cytochrome c biogenesis protein